MLLSLFFLTNARKQDELAAIKELIFIKSYRNSLVYINYLYSLKNIHPI